MKHFAISLLFACCSLGCMAQTWSPVVRGVKANYGTGASISYTVWVDSVSYSLTDSTYHLNRVIAPCPTCPVQQYCNSMFLNNQGSVFLKDMRFNGQYIRLSGNSTQHPLYISTSKQLNASWIYDSIANIRATITGLLQTVLWSQTDSIEQISLSNGKLIVLSKNHGALDFPDPWTNGTVTLTGQEAPVPLGVQTAMFPDLFSFNTGDVLEYLEHLGSRFPDQDIYTLCTITSKNATPDSIHFDMHVKRKTCRYMNYNPYDTVYSSYDSSVTFFRNERLYDAHNHMPLFHGGCSDYIPVELGWNSTFSCQTKGYCAGHSQGPYLMKQGNGDTLGLTYAPASYSACPEQLSHQTIFGNGLGLLYSYATNMSYPYPTTDEKILIAAQVNSRTMGNFVSVTGFQLSSKQNTIAYPNPCHGATAVECSDIITELRIYDTTGRLLSTSVPDARSATLTMPGSGVYFVRIYFGGTHTTERVVSY
ncbi:MAG TPA: T9SS type A sorting domain-containing protein [Bacteroidia bacterium]|jgi:hypothetical protein|nr:T9SS type A sorting domain-containing protein [Bacteroidia bacterium]